MPRACMDRYAPLRGLYTKRARTHDDAPPTCHVLTHLLCHHEQIVDHVLWLACKLGAQHRVLAGAAMGQVRLCE